MTPPAGPALVRIPASGLRRWTDILLALSLLVMVFSGLGLFAWRRFRAKHAALH
jgi:hypothetical protein